MPSCRSRTKYRKNEKEKDEKQDSGNDVRTRFNYTKMELNGWCVLQKTNHLCGLCAGS